MMILQNYCKLANWIILLFKYTEVLYQYFKDNDLQVLKYIEAAGRFIFHMQSFSVVFQAFDSIDIFEEEGRNWYLFLKVILENWSRHV